MDPSGSYTNRLLRQSWILNPKPPNDPPFGFFTNTQLTTLAFLPTLCFHIYEQFSFLFAPTEGIKYEIRNQWVCEDYIERLHALLN